MKIKLAFITLLFTLLMNTNVFADSILPDPIQDPKAPYRLFRTSNYWTFLKLDTRDGRIWQVQFDIQGDDRFTTVLNDRPLIDQKNKTVGRFTLYPTSNFYNYILLDQIDGRTWQVQWSTEPYERIVIPIE